MESFRNDMKDVLKRDEETKRLQMTPWMRRDVWSGVW